MKLDGAAADARVEERDVRGWGREQSALMINERKAPIRRPRVRGTEGERKVGGCELFRRDEQRQRHVWDCLTRGLTMRWIVPRRYRNEEAACGIEKSGGRAICESQRAEVDALLHRKLHDLRDSVRGC